MAALALAAARARLLRAMADALAKHDRIAYPYSMRSCAIVVVALFACERSTTRAKVPPPPGVSIGGHGLRATVLPSTFVLRLHSDFILFNAHGDTPLAKGATVGTMLHDKQLEVAIRPGRAPSGALRPRAVDRLITYSDGQDDTTTILLEEGRQTYEGVLGEILIDPSLDGWIVTADGKDQPLSFEILEVAVDGKSFRSLPDH
jgi:hypothetical protein